jgi:hypothetical protein
VTNRSVKEEIHERGRKTLGRYQEGTVRRQIQMQKLGYQMTDLKQEHFGNKNKKKS